MEKEIIFTVTNDLTFDQRMIRICTSLAKHGYRVQLVGRKRTLSPPLAKQIFQQTRLSVFFQKGALFYAEFNLRLFFYLLFKRPSLICAIDLDTILPCYFISRLKKIPRVYDAHELFCEMQEIVTRPMVHAFWKKIERFTVPKFPHGYTVNQIIAEEFQSMYNVHYKVVRNIAILENKTSTEKREKFILYQGAVNEGRSFGVLIPAMVRVDARLVICGDGNFMEETKALVRFHHLEQKVIFKGLVLPSDLKSITASAYIGLTLFDQRGKSNYYSLANRFFDYIHGGIPQLCVDFPAYREINNLHEVAVLINDISPENLANSLNDLLQNEQLYKRLAANCILTRQLYNWQEEEKKLLTFYQTLME